ncbi:Oxygen tolerance [Mariniphaga anaerophila]|uniref:Oxygen tolerance n=1 Tax=Mariniphaga anaerophila TaxID=1484053 RepID=A0A1M5G960_9BACT|nr:BatD family protein [Mariniphaga anaerophila]SHG00224.1 Oxygen tolerance [Mariniphaga anaerophila]
MIKRILIYVSLFFAIASANAEQTRFVMSAPNAVEMGQQFRLTFTLNDRGSNLQLPPGLTSNFDVLMGPSTGQSTSIRTINGRTTTEVTFSYTYILRAKSEGNFEVRPATIEVDGKVVESNSFKIQVVPAQSASQQQQQQAPQGGQNGQSSKSVDLGGDNLFLRVEMSKQNVFRGEQIISTVKIYADPNIPISGFDEVNLPTYEGFFTQDIEIPNQINFTREVYNNRIYQVGVLKKTVLFPQQNGALTIKPFSMTLLVQQRVRPRSFFDDFFSGIQTARTTITSKAVRVNVKDLPTQPANFYGGVGNFSVSSEISAEDVTTNDAVTLKFTVKGSGNLRLIRNPELKLPSDFEVYDPRSTENIQVTDNGASGSKTVEYLFQPRFEGDYTIPSISFAFFNPATGTYETRSTQEYTLHVEKGTGEQAATMMSSRQRENLQLLGQDIRFIKQGNPVLRMKGTTFYGTLFFYGIYGATALLFLALFIIYRKKARENANVALMRNKKASRVAVKRLKAAAGFMKKNDDEAFHEAILKAFWGYLSDKLSIPVANLNRESALAGLREKSVDEEQINSFVEIIEQCEFARYAPSGGSQARTELYKKAAATMSRLEKQIKR